MSVNLNPAGIVAPAPSEADRLLQAVLVAWDAFASSRNTSNRKKHVLGDALKAFRASVPDGGWMKALKKHKRNHQTASRYILYATMFTRFTDNLKAVYPDANPYDFPHDAVRVGALHKGKISERWFENGENIPDDDQDDDGKKKPVKTNTTTTETDPPYTGTGKPVANEPLPEHTGNEPKVTNPAILCHQVESAGGTVVRKKPGKDGKLHAQPTWEGKPILLVAEGWGEDAQAK